MSPLGSRSLTVALLADINCPGSQKDLVSNWEPAHSLVEDAVCGAEIAPHLPALDVTRLPLCLQRGMGRSAAGWLSSGVHSILCSVSGPACALELFSEKFSLSLSLSLALPQFISLSHISSLRLSSGHSGLALTLNMQSASLCSGPVHWWWM